MYSPRTHRRHASSTCPTAANLDSPIALAETDPLAPAAEPTDDLIVEITMINQASDQVAFITGHTQNDAARVHRGYRCWTLAADEVAICRRCRSSITGRAVGAVV
jgi:hypothetical protein